MAATEAYWKFGLGSSLSGLTSDESHTQAALNVTHSPSLPAANTWSFHHHPPSPDNHATLSLSPRTPLIPLRPIPRPFILFVAVYLLCDSDRSNITRRPP